MLKPEVETGSPCTSSKQVMRGFAGVVVGSLLAVSAHAGLYEDALTRFNHTDYPGAAALLKNSAEDARSLELLGRCYLMNADFSAAAATLEKAVTMAPEDSMTRTWLARAYGHRAETSFAFAAMNYAIKARQNFETAVHLDTTNSEAVDDLFEFYLQAPGIVGGSAEKARGLLPLIARHDPAQALFAQARIAERNKEYGAAESQLRRAVELEPHSTGHILNLARFLFQRGRYDEGENYFDQAAAVGPLRRVLYARAECYIAARHNVDQARNLLRRYLAAKDLTPEDAPRSDALKLLKQSEGM